MNRADYLQEHFAEAHKSFKSVDAAVAPDGARRTVSAYAVVPTARAFISELEQQIARARRSIDIQFYAFEADEIGLPIARALVVAAKRQVVVRILLDHVASHPLKWLSSYGMLRGMNATRNIAARVARTTPLANPLKRDHKKMVLIDRHGDDPDRPATAYIGGMNIARRNMSWNDFMMRIQGPMAGLIAEDFERTWHGENTAPYERLCPEEESSLLSDTRDSGIIVARALKAIAAARQRIWVETPYLDWRVMRMALMRAKMARPSLDVRVIVPGRNNYPPYQLVTRARLRPLAKRDIAVYLYGKPAPQMNHAKLIIADDTALFGSSNFHTNHTVGGNAELTVMTSNQACVQQLMRWFEEDERYSVSC
jgi:cardiolipin synthase